jgi:hypothetical protein
MAALLEKRLNRGGGQVAPADEPLVSLMDGRDVKGAARFFSISRHPAEVAESGDRSPARPSARAADGVSELRSVAKGADRPASG